MIHAKLTITMPAWALRTGRHRSIISAATRASGGSTIVRGTGYWVDPESGVCVHEDVVEVSYLATDTNYNMVHAAVMGIVRTMLDSGEKAVLVQHWINGSFGFHLYTKENLQ